MQSFQLFRIELNHFSAFGTEHVVMVFMAPSLFVNGAAFTLGDLLNKAAFAKKA